MDLTSEEWRLIESCIGRELAYIRNWIENDDKAGRKAEESFRMLICQRRSQCERLLRNIACREDFSSWQAPKPLKGYLIPIDEAPKAHPVWESADLL